MHHNKPRRGGRGGFSHGSRGKGPIYLIAAIAVAIILLATWQSAVFSREAAGEGGAAAGAGGRSFLWRLKRMSAGGEKDGRVREKAADVERRRLHSNSIRGDPASAAASADAKPRSLAGVGGEPAPPANAEVDDSNAVDDVGATDNSDADPKRRIVQSARKVRGEHAQPHPQPVDGDKAVANDANDDTEAKGKKGSGKGKGASQRKAGKGGKGGKGKKKGGDKKKPKAADFEDGSGDGQGEERIGAPTTVAAVPSVAALSANDDKYFYNNVSLRSQGALPPLAYALIISNEEFLDGALVLGVSLRRRCSSLSDAPARAALTIIVPKGRLSDDSLRRLREEGTFDEVVLVNSLAPRAPGAFWKDTFDKLYMFSLVHYTKVVFMDADMICMRSMDKLLEFRLNDNKHVGAIGDKGGFPGTNGAAYFQTGMMVIEPSLEAFAEVMEEFDSGVPPRGQQYNRGMNGRDGVLLRNYFKQRFHPIDNKYSRNLNPRFTIPDSVVSLHPRGKHKPWFDWTLPIKDPDLGKKEFGFPYLEWWELFEVHVHKQAPLYQYALRKKAALDRLAQLTKEREEGDGDKEETLGMGFGLDAAAAFAPDPFYEVRLQRYGGAFNASGGTFEDSFETHVARLSEGAADTDDGAAAANGDGAFGAANGGGGGAKQIAASLLRRIPPMLPISPLTHVWLMRYSKSEYVQLLSDEDARRRSDISAVLLEGEQGGNVRNDWSPEGRATNAALIAEGKTADASSFEMVVGKLGQSCDEACGDAAKRRGGGDADGPNFKCVGQGFHYAPFQNCTVLKERFGCEICELGVYWRPHPGGDYPASGYYRKQNGEAKGPLRCFYNMIRDDRGLPRCSAYNESTTRICPCAAVGKTD